MKGTSYLISPDLSVSAAMTLAVDRVNSLYPPGGCVWGQVVCDGRAPVSKASIVCGLRVLI